MLSCKEPNPDKIPYFINAYSLFFLLTSWHLLIAPLCQTSAVNQPSTSKPSRCLENTGPTIACQHQPGCKETTSRTMALVATSTETYIPYSMPIHHHRQQQDCPHCWSTLRMCHSHLTSCCHRLWLWWTWKMAQAAIPLLNFTLPSHTCSTYVILTSWKWPNF